MYSVKVIQGYQGLRVSEDRSAVYILVGPYSGEFENCGVRSLSDMGRSFGVGLFKPGLTTMAEDKDLGIRGCSGRKLPELHFRSLMYVEMRRELQVFGSVAVVKGAGLSTSPCRKTTVAYKVVHGLLCS